MHANALTAMVVAVMLAGSAPAHGQTGGSAAQQLVPACTPELVYSVTPAGREMDARGSGTGIAANLRSTDANGTAQPAGPATVQWSARGVVREPDRSTGVRPQIAGDLDLTIATGTGERIAFSATCIAAVVGFRQGLVVYANGLTTGWPGSEVRRTLVHFEAYTDDTAYVALVDGTDCRRTSTRWS